MFHPTFSQTPNFPHTFFHLDKSKNQDHLVSHPLPDLDTLVEFLYLQIPPISNQDIHPTHKEFTTGGKVIHIDKEHQFADQKEEKKEEGMRG